MELKRPEIVNLEDFFNEYVKYFGGQVISPHKQNLIDRANADYLFKNENVMVN